MKRRIGLLMLVLVQVVCVGSQLRAVEPTTEEMATARNWIAKVFGAQPSVLPFSFTYGGRPSTDLLGSWKINQNSKQLDEFRSQRTIAFTDPSTGLQVKCVMVQYNDYPTVEWTLYFKNTSAHATPILENIDALDTLFERGMTGEFLLHYSEGSPAKPTDYQPLKTTLLQGMRMQLSPVGGRPTDGTLPDFDIEWSGGGAIVSVGWPGQWLASFTRNETTGLRVQAGQELTHFKLLPGEEVRTPLIVIQFYKGGWVRAQNIWRRWMMAHSIPRPGGKLPSAQLAGGTCPFFGFIHNDEQNQELFIRRYTEEGIKLDDWWIDAGWYPNDGKWTNTGTWEVDKTRFPGGLRAVSDYAHARGMKLIVWFEPERVTRGTWLWKHHPEWLLKCPEEEQRGQRLLNLGNPAARKWLVAHMEKFIKKQGIDVYRTDFNIAPLPFWRDHDARDREGITEIKYVTGFLDYLDELRQKFPDLLIDTCASGGRRNDLETLRRAVPLWRSDYIIKPVGMQDQTYGISFWIPFYGGASQIFETENGAGSKTIDTYDFRSDMYPAIHAHWDVRRTDIDYGRLRELVEQWRRIAPDYMGDYYPLTPYKTKNDVWMAWQLDRPNRGEGVVQVFRRAESAQNSAWFKLNALNPGAQYDLRNLDTNTDHKATGRELIERGLLVTLKDQPGSAIIVYKKLDAQQGE